MMTPEPETRALCSQPVCLVHYEKHPVFLSRHKCIVDCANPRCLARTFDLNNKTFDGGVYHPVGACEIVYGPLLADGVHFWPVLNDPYERLRHLHPAERRERWARALEREVQRRIPFCGQGSEPMRALEDRIPWGWPVLGPSACLALHPWPSPFPCTCARCRPSEEQIKPYIPCARCGARLFHSWRLGCGHSVCIGCVYPNLVEVSSHWRTLKTPRCAACRSVIHKAAPNHALCLPIAPKTETERAIEDWLRMRFGL